MREHFWEDLKGCIEASKDKGRVVVSGDMNVRVGDMEVEGVIGKFGVPGVNENGGKLIEKRMRAGNTFFGKKDIHN